MRARLLLLLATFAIACGPRTEGLDPSRLPEEIRADYDLFARRCSKCHPLARPLNAGITDDAQWVMYVNRMRRQPGSGISYDDQEHILRFLHWYAADLRKKESEKRGGAPAPSAPSATPSAAPPPPAVTTEAPPTPIIDGGG